MVFSNDVCSNFYRDEFANFIEIWVITSKIKALSDGDCLYAVDANIVTYLVLL